MRTMRESNKKSFREKLFSPRSLILIYILLPILIMGIGFSAWSTITPDFSGRVFSGVTSERLIDTSALMSINRFEPFTKQLYYTGAVDGEGKLQNELHIETEISLKMANIYQVAKDCNKTELYLSLTLSLNSGEEKSFFYDLDSGESDFTFNFVNKTQNASNVGGENVTLTVSSSETQPEATTSGVTLLLKLTFSENVADRPFADSDEMVIAPEFVLGANGYAEFFSLAKNKAKFRLDLRLSESSPI